MSKLRFLNLFHEDKNQVQCVPSLQIPSNNNFALGKVHFRHFPILGVYLHSACFTKLWRNRQYQPVHYIKCLHSVSHLIDCLLISQSAEHVPGELFGFYSPEWSDRGRTVTHCLSAICYHCTASERQPPVCVQHFTNDSWLITTAL